MALELTIHPEASNPSPYQIKNGKAPDIVNNEFFGSFGDFVDMINPLQHLPVVSTLYRAITGDTMNSGAQIAGGAIFGGPLGIIGSIANLILAQETGNTVEEKLFAAASGSYQKTGDGLSAVPQITLAQS